MPETSDTSAATGPRTGREELRRMAADARQAVLLATGRAELPEPTPSDGPDPYGVADPEWMTIDWSEHLRQIEVVGARVNYVEMGEGSPVVFVHGLSGAWQNWLEQLPEFARTHRVIALDLPGFGASPMPPWDISIPEYGNFLRDFCEKLGIEHAAIVGNSLGGFVATEVAISEADRVDKLVLVSAAGITWARARREPFEVMARMARAATPLTLRFQLTGMKRSRIRQAAFQGVFHDPNALRRELLWESFVPALDAPAFYDAMVSLAGYDIRDRLSDIEDPTLIVWGRNDRVVPVPAALSYKRRIDHAALHIFDETGHVPQMERPVRFNRLLSEFLAE